MVRMEQTIDLGQAVPSVLPLQLRKMVPWRKTAPLILCGRHQFAPPRFENINS